MSRVFGSNISPSSFQLQHSSIFLDLQGTHKNSSCKAKDSVLVHYIYLNITNHICSSYNIIKTLLMLSTTSNKLNIYLM